MAEIRLVIGELKALQGLKDLEQEMELVRQKLPSQGDAFQKVLGCQGVALAAAGIAAALGISGELGRIVAGQIERAAEEERWRWEEYAGLGKMSETRELK